MAHVLSITHLFPLRGTLIILTLTRKLNLDKKNLIHQRTLLYWKKREEESIPLLFLFCFVFFCLPPQVQWKTAFLFPAVLVCLGFRDKVPQAGWLKHQKCAVSELWRLESETEVSAGLVLSENCSIRLS